MSDTLINSLNGRITELTQQVANLNAALKGERKEAGRLKGELEAARGQVGTLTTERDRFKSQVEAAPGDQAKRVADLESTLRSRDHFDGYREAAIAAGVRPESVKDLYQLSGLTPPAEGEITPALFAESLAASKQSRGWAFGDSQSTAGQPSPQSQGTQQGSGVAATPPPPGPGRGASDRSSARFTFKASDLADARWMAANQGQLAEAVRNGTAQQLPG